MNRGLFGRWVGGSSFKRDGWVPYLSYYEKSNDDAYSSVGRGSHGKIHEFKNDRLVAGLASVRERSAVFRDEFSGDNCRKPLGQYDLGRGKLGFRARTG